MFIVFKPDGSYHTEETGSCSPLACEEYDVLFNTSNRKWYISIHIVGYETHRRWILAPTNNIDKKLQLAALLLC